MAGRWTDVAVERGRLQAGRPHPACCSPPYIPRRPQARSAELQLQLRQLAAEAATASSAYRDAVAALDMERARSDSMQVGPWEGCLAYLGRGLSAFPTVRAEVGGHIGASGCTCTTHN